MKRYVITAWENYSRKVLFWAVSVFASVSLERLDGSQPNFHPIENGRCWFNRLAAILEKHCFPAPGSLILTSSSFKLSRIQQVPAFTVSISYETKQEKMGWKV